MDWDSARNSGARTEDDTTGHCSILALDQSANLARLFAELCGFASESPVPIGLFTGDKFSEICALFESDNRLVHFSLARGEPSRRACACWAYLLAARGYLC